jgi:hypothetical protein
MIKKKLSENYKGFMDSNICKMKKSFTNYLRYQEKIFWMILKILELKVKEKSLF